MKNYQIKNYLLVFITGFMVQSLTSQETEEDFIRIAGKIASASDDIQKVWPDFWSEDEPFLFMKHDSIVHVYNVINPEGDYEKIKAEKLPQSLKDKAFRKKSYLPEYVDLKHTFPGQYKVGKVEVYALEPKGSDDFRKIDFYLHESFHYFQRPNWEKTVGDTVSIRMGQPILDTIVQVKNEKFINLLNLERNLLAQSLETSSEDSIKENLKKIMIIRERRDAMIPARAKDLMERYIRREGSATYTGLQASAMANNFPKDSVYAEIKQGLLKPFSEFPSFPMEEQRFLRWPHYAIGASIALLMDKIEIPGWKKELAEGKTFYQILQENLPISKKERNTLEKEVTRNIKSF
ncbi:hypothetical protein [Salinimicrobium terrae]|uniref:hypothetical protein n=1 Tax=Salinimicrobium terrae TaxID=470866 RepID=UPI000491D771|nr:hypothetical protein [Salinimicrobium terrae]